MNGPNWICVGAVFCGLAVGTGAFAAHGLGKIFAEKYRDMTRIEAGQEIPLAAKFLNDFKTGAEYQMYHGLALIAVGVIGRYRATMLLTVAGWAFAFGILLFSGSLYILTLTGVTKWGAVTPIGGTLFLIGWTLLTVAAFGWKPALPVQPESRDDVN